MREVLYRVYLGSSKYSDFIYKAVFHQWIVKPKKNFDSETYAIVETKDGLLKEIRIDNVKFVNKKNKL